MCTFDAVIVLLITMLVHLFDAVTLVINIVSVLLLTPLSKTVVTRPRPLYRPRPLNRPYATIYTVFVRIISVSLYAVQDESP